MYFALIVAAFILPSAVLSFDTDKYHCCAANKYTATVFMPNQTDVVVDHDQNKFLFTPTGDVSYSKLLVDISTQKGYIFYNNGICKIRPSPVPLNALSQCISKRATFFGDIRLGKDTGKNMNIKGFFARDDSKKYFATGAINNNCMPVFTSVLQGDNQMTMLFVNVTTANFPTDAFDGLSTEGCTDDEIIG